MTRESLNTAVLDSLRMNRSVVVVMVAYILAALVLGRLAGIDVALRIYGGTASLLVVLGFLLVLIPIVLRQLLRHRPASPIRFSWRVIKDLRIVERAIIALPCIMLFPQFSSAFTSVKSAIPLLNPYGLDPLLANWDSLVHGGHAWELIHPLVGYPLVTFVLNFSYNLWLFIILIIFALVTVITSDRELREQYLLSFFGCWILLGSVAAIGLSSVGPAFYGLLYPSDPYAPLMSYLRSVDELYPIWALPTQDMLWASYESNSAGIGSGISAMPRCRHWKRHLRHAEPPRGPHDAQRDFAVAAVAHRRHPGLGVSGAYPRGSVHLGWHYAIDGYASILAVLLIWRMAGWWASRSESSALVLVRST